MCLILTHLLAFHLHFQSPLIALITTETRTDQSLTNLLRFSMTNLQLTKPQTPTSSSRLSSLQHIHKPSLASACFTAVHLSRCLWAFSGTFSERTSLSIPRFCKGFGPCLTFLAFPIEAMCCAAFSQIFYQSDNNLPAVLRLRLNQNKLHCFTVTKFNTTCLEA